MTNLLSVVIPAYNEENGIVAIATRVLSVKAELAKVGVDRLELLVVDDGSQDRTAEVAAGVEGVTVIKHLSNRGYGAALKTGFSKAQGNLIGFLDADGTYPPEWFPQLCQKAMNGSDLVIGSRMSGGESRMPGTRRLGNFIFAGLLSLLGPERVTDSASGMRVFKREILGKLYPLPDGLNLTPVMSARALHEGVTTTEVSIPYAERVGDSKLSVVHDGSLFLTSMLWTVMAYNPARILGAVGLGSVAFACLVGLGLLLARLAGTTSLGPVAVTVLYSALIFGVSGISLFTLAATFNFLVGLFNKEPVREGFLERTFFRSSMEQHFGWLGLSLVVVGTVIAILSLTLGIRGWAVERIWLYLLGAAMSTLIGIQLVISWILAGVMRALSERDILTIKDLNAT